MAGLDEGLYEALVRRGMSRRSFIKFSAAMATALALPASYAPRIAKAVAEAPRLPVIWLRGQACAGNSEAFFQATDPTVSELVLGLLSIDYHEALLAPAGDAAELSRLTTMEQHPNGYIAVIEGGIPTAEGGAYCIVGGRPFADIAREVCDGAIATIAVGSCAFDGGLPAASGGSTGATGAGHVVPDSRLINLPGCPLNVENLTSTIVHYLTFKEFPPTDGRRRPLFAYGNLLHNQCERRAHYEFGEFALAWGDEGAQKGWCLYKLGCKGPETFANCPTARYADDTSWPIKAGHGCVGCTMPGFWDAMSPWYRRLPGPLPFMPGVTADTVGWGLMAAIAGAVGVHTVGSIVREKVMAAEERKALAAAAAGPETTMIPPPLPAPQPAEAEPLVQAVPEPLVQALPEPAAEAISPAEATPPAETEPEPPAGIEPPSPDEPSPDEPSPGGGAS